MKLLPMKPGAAGDQDSHAHQGYRRTTAEVAEHSW